MGGGIKHEQSHECSLGAFIYVLPSPSWTLFAYHLGIQLPRVRSGQAFSRLVPIFSTQSIYSLPATGAYSRAHLHNRKNFQRTFITIEGLRSA